MVADDADTQELIASARGGDAAARQQLLTRYRQRLCRMVAVRLDRRLAARLDASDVVQDALLDAAQQLSTYLREPPLPFYPWLRRLAWEHLVKLHQHHLTARKRSATREQHVVFGLSDDSVQELARCLAGPDTSPSNHLLRAELQERVRDALARLPEGEREVLVLRYLEQLPISEVAAVLGISEGAVKMRRLRALERMCGLLGIHPGEERP